MNPKLAVEKAFVQVFTKGHHNTLLLNLMSFTITLAGSTIMLWMLLDTCIADDDQCK